MHSACDDAKKKMRFQSSPPLCLFYFPGETSFTPKMKKTYVSALPKKQFKINRGRRKKWKLENPPVPETQNKTEENNGIGPKKRPEARVVKSKLNQPIRNLKSYLLNSVKNEKVPKKADLPCFNEVLETVKDAWPPPPFRRNFFFNRRDNQKHQANQNGMLVTKDKTKEEILLPFPSPLINRRFSVPEELMRKYSITRGKSWEESEAAKRTNGTTTLSTATDETTKGELPSHLQYSAAGRAESMINMKGEDGGEEGSLKMTPIDIVHLPLAKRSEKPTRVTKGESDSMGKGIIRVREAKGPCFCTCRREKDENSDTPASSSPDLRLPKQEPLSDMLSSESDRLQCTCRELASSKETSTDVFRSGQSTLSQTISDKSVSTQDATASVRSVSTRGSNCTDNSYSTTPEACKTSAKDSTMTATTTDDNGTSRTPRNYINFEFLKINGYCDVEHEKSCPIYREIKHSLNNYRNSRQCPIHSNPSVYTKSCAINTDLSLKNLMQTADCAEKAEREESGLMVAEQNAEEAGDDAGEAYTWAKLSHDELYMMQQLRAQKLLERRFDISAIVEPETSDAMILEYEDENEENEDEDMEQSIMIPRYSALPRTLSMLVNTSSPDNSNDSDNLSLPDSLEDQPTTHIHRYYFDTEKESKPVRGEVRNSFEVKKPVVAPLPKSKAFFVSMKDPLNEEVLLETVKKIPEPPEKIKNRIKERHSNLNEKHKLSHRNAENGSLQRKKKKFARTNKREDVAKRMKSKRGSRTKRHEANEIAKFGKPKISPRRQFSSERQAKRDALQESENRQKTAKRKKEVKESAKGRPSSKIPIFVTNHSNSSPETEEEALSLPEKAKESSPFVESTQILEIEQKDRRPNSQTTSQKSRPLSPPGTAKPVHRNHLTIPPLVSNPGTQTPLRFAFNRPIFLGQSRRSPVPRYRQRFEVIPEEKSSSLSSTEEKSNAESLPKFKSTGTSPLPTKDEKTENNNENEMSNLIITEDDDKRFKGLPYLKGTEDQKIILFSSKPSESNSTKGRDALIAMNREDFNRLARGWINFYKLRENFESASDLDNRTERNGKKQDDKNQYRNHLHGKSQRESVKSARRSASEVKQINLKEDQKNNNVENDGRKPGSKIRSDNMANNGNQWHEIIDDNNKQHLNSSETVFQTVRTISPKNLRGSPPKKSSLPNLTLSAERPKTKSTGTTRTADSLPSVIRSGEFSDEDVDSDSTEYMEPPGLRVPPLPLEDVPSDATVPSDESELDDDESYLASNTMNTTENWRSADSKTRNGTKRNCGWSVLVAGTVQLSRTEPDLEMRLSFPGNGNPPVAVYRSDSGWIDDSIDAVEDENGTFSRKEIAALFKKSKYKKFTENFPDRKQGDARNRVELKIPKCLNRFVTGNSDSPPNGSRTRAKKMLKKSLRKIIAKKLFSVWPKIQKVIQDEFYDEDYRYLNEFSDILSEYDLLSVRGTAISLEKKEKPLTMTERDVTKRHTSRESK